MKLARMIGAVLVLLLGACDPPDISKGDSYEASVRRADEARAAGNIDTAIPLYERFVAALRTRGLEVATGEFGADMLVEIHNDGPVTLILDRA